jgi:hypothetical protein
MYTASGFPQLASGVSRGTGPFPERRLAYSPVARLLDEGAGWSRGGKQTAKRFQMIIQEQGNTLTSDTDDRDSISLGTIRLDHFGEARFTPVPGMSFSHRMLSEISEFVKNTAETVTEHRKN